MDTLPEFVSHLNEGTRFFTTRRERDVMKDLLRSRRRDYNQIREQIPTSNLPTHLETTYIRLKTEISRLKSALAPIRILDNETCKKLFFQFCTPEPYTSTVYRAGPEMRPSSGPMLLTRINRGLRHMALVTPGIWSSLHIDQRVTEQGLKNWIARANNEPLRISICGQLDAAVVTRLITYRKRWYHLTLDACYYPQILRLRKEDVPILTSIDFGKTHYAVRSKANKAEKSKMLLEAPNLTCVKILPRYEWQAASVDFLTWSKFKRITIHTPSTQMWGQAAQDVCKMLRTTSKLVSFDLKLVDMAHFEKGMVPSPNESPIVLSELKNLRLEVVTETNIADCIYAPLLERLTYSLHALTRPRQPLEKLLIRSPNIRHLRLEQTPFAEVLECLPNCPQLEVLDLWSARPAPANEGNGQYPGDMYLLPFTGPNGLCPNLMFFRSSSHWPLAISRTALYNFVMHKSRLMQDTCSWKVIVLHVSYVADVDKEAIAELRKRAGKGVKLIVNMWQEVDDEAENWWPTTSFE